MYKRLQELVPDTVLKRCAVVPKDALPTGLFHISPDPELKVMTPKIPTRTLRAEDASFPRVCVSSSWMGCIYGHSGTLQDFREASSGGREWLGGYVIFRTPFEVALRPHTSLLADVNISDEHWLFDMGEDIQSSFRTERVGECFIRYIEEVLVPEGKVKARKAPMPTYYLKFTEDNIPIWLCGGEFTLCRKGCYSVQVPDYYYVRGVLMPHEFIMRRISEEAYLEAKQENLVLLSHGASGSFNW